MSIDSQGKRDLDDSTPENQENKNETVRQEIKETPGKELLPDAKPKSAKIPVETGENKHFYSEEDYEKVVSEKRDSYDRLLRKQAELDNFRKRAIREKEEFHRYAGESIVRDLLPLLDGFSRALRPKNPNIPEEYYRGIELLCRDLNEVLIRAGVKKIKAKGETFDPYLHEAIETVESVKNRDSEVLEEFQVGYKLKDRLLRPSLVKVAVPPAVVDNKSKKENKEKK